MAEASVFSATVTALAGPSKQSTASVFTGLRSIAVDVKREVISLYVGEPGSGPIKEFDLHGVTTITDTIVAGVHAIVIS
jgi:hypothetical protein